MTIHARIEDLEHKARTRTATSDEEAELSQLRKQYPPGAAGEDQAKKAGMEAGQEEEAPPELEDAQAIEFDPWAKPGQGSADVQPDPPPVPQAVPDAYAHTRLPRRRVAKMPILARAEAQQYVTIRVPVVVHLALKSRARESGRTMISWLSRAVGVGK